MADLTTHMLIWNPGEAARLVAPAEDVRHLRCSWGCCNEAVRRGSLEYRRSELAGAIALLHRDGVPAASILRAVAGLAELRQ